MTYERSQLYGEQLHLPGSDQAAVALAKLPLLSIVALLLCCSAALLLCYSAALLLCYSAALLCCRHYATVSHSCPAPVLVTRPPPLPFPLFPFPLVLSPASSPPLLLHSFSTPFQLLLLHPSTPSLSSDTCLLRHPVKGLCQTITGTYPSSAPRVGIASASLHGVESVKRLTTPTHP